MEGSMEIIAGSGCRSMVDRERPEGRTAAPSDPEARGRTAPDGPSLVLTDPYRRNRDLFLAQFRAAKYIPKDTGKLLINSSDSSVSTHGQRICGCCCSAAVYSRKEPIEGSKNYTARVQACGSRWCPYCSTELSADLADRVHGVLDGFRSSRGPLKHVILTARACGIEGLRERVKSFIKAGGNYCKNLRRYRGMEGYMLRYEVTVPELSRVHVHAHLYVDMPYVRQSELLRSWQLISSRQGLDGRNLHVKALKDPSQSAYEMSKYISKPIPKKLQTEYVMQSLCKAFWKRKLFESWGTLDVPPVSKLSNGWVRLGVLHQLDKAYFEGRYDDCLIPESVINCLRDLSKHPQAAVLLDSRPMAELLERHGIRVAIPSTR